MKNFEIKNQNGRSMIEMLGVLAIIGVLSVGGIAGYSKAMMKYRINKTIEQITLISGNVRTFFAMQRDYEGLDSSTDDGRKIIQKAKLVPDEMWNEDKTALVNAFGGNFSLISTHKSSIDNKAFKMELSSIPEEACIDLVSNDWREAGIIFFGEETESKAVVLPASIDLAISFCQTETIYAFFNVDIDYYSHGFQFIN